MKKLFLFIFATMLAGQAWAENYDFSAECSSGQTLYYKITSDSTVSVTFPNRYSNSEYYYNFTKPFGDLIIPEMATYNSEEYLVTEIGGQAFYGCNGLNKVTIPNTILSIGNNAFMECGDLGLNIPNSVINFGNGIFIHTTLTYNEYDNAYYLGDDENPYHLLVIAKNQDITSCDIHPDTKFILGNYANVGSSLSEEDRLSAFYKCDKLASITIPKGVKVIGDAAFCGCSGLTSIVIPTSVISIGESAFYNCCGLTSVVIPNSVTNIARSAFNNDEIKFNCEFESRPEGWSIPPIGSSENYWYWNYNKGTICWNVSKIDKNIKYLRITDSTVTVVGFVESDNSVTIPDTILIYGEKYAVTSIGDNAFYGCSGLTSVTIPNSIINIGKNAFNGCEKLDYNVYDNGCYVGNDDNPYLALFMTKKQDITSCTINSKCKVICGGAFSGCNNLLSITIPESVINIGANAFNNCNKLEKAEFASINNFCGFRFENANANPLTYAHHLYINGEEVTDLVIPNTVTAIGNYALTGCNNLKSVSIPNTITDIGEYAFSGCNSLKSLTIPNSVVSVGKSTFNGCDSLTAVTTESNADFSNSALYFKNDGFRYQVLDKERVEIVGIDRIQEFGWSSWGGGGSLEKIGKTQMTIPATVTAGNTYNVVGIGKSAFARISNLTSVIIPNSVTNIKEGAFSNCSALKSITIAESVKNIGGNAFNSNSIETIEFNTDSISTHFSGKTSLTTVHIGESVTIIKPNSFTDCYNLTTVTSAATTPPTLPDGDPFPKADTIYVKAGSVEAYQTAPYWKRKVILTYNTVAIKNVGDSTGTIDGSRFLLGEKGTTLTAVPAEGFHFVKWNDGDTINPRQFTSVAEISASFEKHTIVVDSAVTATCITNGLSEGSHCSVCGKVIKEQFNYGMASHNYVTDTAVAATCTKSGLTSGRHCSVCGTVFVSQDTIPALGHHFGYYVYNNDATTEADGTETAVCEHGCGTTDTRVKEGTKLPKDNTAVSESAVDNLVVYAVGKTIVVENATEEIRVYNAMGALVGCVGRDVPWRVSTGTTTITVNGTGIYIVKTGGIVKRVMVN